MQVTVETTGALGRRMTVAVPAERVEREVSARMKRLSQTVRFPGFRPGKAPMKMVEAQYGGQVLEEVVGDLIRSTFYEALGEKGLKPAGGPKIEPKPVDRGRDFEYTATFEVYPEVTRLDLKGCRIERPVATIGDEDIDRTIETLRSQRTTWRSVDRPAGNGDRVIIDFEGSVGGTPFEGGTAKDFPLVLGNNVLIDGFETGIVGMSAGESRTLNLNFPADYRNSALAGKQAQFAVTVKQVNEPVLPEVDDAFAKSLGVSDGKIETLRAEVRSNLERELNERVRRDLRDQVFKSIVEVNAFDVPDALVEAETAHLIDTSRRNVEAQGLRGDQVPTDPALYAEQARRRVKLGLILADVIKARGLSADPARVRARVEEIAAGYETPQEFISWHYAKPGRLGEIESQILEEQAMELLLETAEVTDKAMSFQELVRPNPSA
jgi:trigger factor